MRRAPSSDGPGSLAALFDPRSVAVVGASANPAKWGYWLASGALAGRARRTVHLVNQRGGGLDGVPFLPDLGCVPTVPEQVVVAVPPPQVRSVVVDGLAAGARCFTVITSGGADPAEERELAALVTAHGGRLLGPNCMGVVDTTTELRLSWGDFPSGSVGLVSQSGNLALEIGRLLARAGEGFSRFVSLGNQRDIDAADALDALIAHEPTRVVAAYVEDFRDGRRLARTMAAAHAAGKPVLLLTLGRSDASGRAAASHTGALVSARAVVESVCRDSGALLLDSAGELVDTAVMLAVAGDRLGRPRPGSDSVTTAGPPPLGAADPTAGGRPGQAGSAAVSDQAAGSSTPASAGAVRDASGREVPAVGESSGHVRSAAVPDQAAGSSVSVREGTDRDASGRGAEAIAVPGERLGRGTSVVVPDRPTSSSAVASAGAVPAHAGAPTPLRVAVVGDSGGQGALAADAMADRGLDVPVLSRVTRDAVAAHLPGRGGCGNPVDLAGAGEADLRNYARITRALLDGGDTDVTVLTGYFGDYATANPDQAAQECEVARELGEAAKKAGRLLVVHTMARDTPALTVLREHGVPVYERIEQAATALAQAARQERATPQPPPPLPTRSPASRVTDGEYPTVRTLLGAHGLDFPAAEFVTTADGAAEAARRRTGYPLVLKAMGLAHKTEAGGVALGIGDEAELRAAFARMRAATGAQRYAVERMVAHPHAIELIAGVRYDPAFGPVAMVGLGGVTAELLADTALALAPLTQRRARELLLSLRHAPLLTGWRGAPAVDLDAAADALCALAQAAAEHPELTELEVNPLLVHPGGAIALDAHGVMA